jgi:hypothetical protein
MAYKIKPLGSSKRAKRRLGIKPAGLRLVIIGFQGPEPIYPEPYQKAV